MHRLLSQAVFARLTCTFLILGASLSGTELGGAQDATPSAIQTSMYPYTPDPALCTGAQRTAEELVELFANATPPVSAGIATTATIPLGRQAEEPVATQIVATIETAFACQNAGDFARFFALLTDHALVTIFPWVTEMVLDEAMAAEMIAPQPPSAEFQQSILGIGGITSVGLGIYTAVVVYLDPNGGDSVFALHLTFVWDGTSWLIDSVIDFQTGE